MKTYLLAVAVLLLALAETGFSISIVSRASWNARASTGVKKFTGPSARVFVHHTVTAACNSVATCGTQLRNMQNYHMNTQKWSDIGYSFLIGGDGKVYEGRGWGVVGAHTINYNSNYGVSFIGNFETQVPSAAMWKALEDLIAYGISKNYISSNYKLNGHRDVYATACPGKNLYAKVKAHARFDKSLG